MRIALYGLPCAGKTTLMSELTDVRVVNGSRELNRLSNNSFKNLPDDEKKTFREKYIEYLCSLNDDIVVSDGHYSFLDNVVFTESDGNAYDVFIYLYVNPETLASRISVSEKNDTYRNIGIAEIEQWQRNEIEALRYECHNRNKDFYVIKGEEITPVKFMEFIKILQDGFSSYNLASEICDMIISAYPEPCRLCIVDGDKTIIKQDSFRVCGNGHTNVFDGSFYTGYQSLVFAQETKDYRYEYNKIADLEINSLVFDRIKEHNFVILSAGITELWDKIAERFGFRNVYANPLISADTKFYVVKLLRSKGYYITAYGDSKNDLYMLKEADKGILFIGDRISKSLSSSFVQGVELLYDKAPEILANNNISELVDDIEACKSSSGINGSRLALSHIRLGQRMGETIKSYIPTEGTAVVVLDRGGRFFGDGVYSTFGGTLYPYNPTIDNIPDLSGYEIVTIVDSVVNTGKSVQKLISSIKQQSSKCEFFIVTNVLQRRAVEVLCEYKIFAIRLSDNFYIGNNQRRQTGGKGPDTADRLFNLI